MVRIALAIVTLLGGLFGALSFPASASADLKVVATTSSLGAIARQVGGQYASVSALALPTQDPHFVDARPHLALELARADLLVLVGLDLEIGWLPTLLVGSRNGNIQRGGRGYLDCSRFVSLLEVPQVRVDRSMGDIHPAGNPHYMYDPHSAIQVARGMAAKMAELDPEHAQSFRDNAGRFEQQLRRAMAGWERQLASLHGQQVIAYHKSFPYLARWLGFGIAEHIEPRPGIPPNPHHVARVLATARQRGVKIILEETYYPRGTGSLIAGRSGARLVVIPGGPNLHEGQTYVDFIRTLVNSLRVPES